jgi:hypothetical protein
MTLRDEWKKPTVEGWERQVREAITDQWRLEMHFHGCIADSDEAKRNAFWRLRRNLTLGDLTMLANLAFLDELDWLLEEGELVEPKAEPEGRN